MIRHPDNSKFRSLLITTILHLLVLLAAPMLVWAEIPCRLERLDEGHSVPVFRIEGYCMPDNLSVSETALLPLSILARGVPGTDGASNTFLGLLRVETGTVESVFPEDKVRQIIRDSVGADVASEFRLSDFSRRITVSDDHLAALVLPPFGLLDQESKIYVLRLAFSDGLSLQGIVPLAAESVLRDEGRMDRFASLGEMWIVEFDRIITRPGSPSREILVFNSTGELVARYPTTVPFHADDESVWFVSDNRLARIGKDGQVRFSDIEMPVSRCRTESHLITVVNEAFVVSDGHAVFVQFYGDGDFSVCAAMVALDGSESLVFSVPREEANVSRGRLLDMQLPEGVIWVHLYMPQKTGREEVLLDGFTVEFEDGSTWEEEPLTYPEVKYRETVFRMDIRGESITETDMDLYGSYPFVWKVR